VSSETNFVASDIYNGATLVDALANESLDGLLEKMGCVDKAGIYVWLRRISPQNARLGTPGTFLEWLVESLGRHQGVVSDNLRHIGRMTVDLGGSALSPGKQEAMKEFSSNFELLKDYKKALSVFDYTQVLYVGESNQLHKRLGDHLRGNTDFAKRILALGYAWEELGLRVVVKPWCHI